MPNDKWVMLISKYYYMCYINEYVNGPMSFISQMLRIFE